MSIKTPLKKRNALKSTLTNTFIRGPPYNAHKNPKYILKKIKKDPQKYVYHGSPYNAYGNPKKKDPQEYVYQGSPL